MKFYNNNELKRVLTIIFEENGISIDDSDTIQTIDSLQYMSILLAIEEELNIEFPDIVLSKNIFENLNEFIENIIICLGDRYLEE